MKFWAITDKGLVRKGNEDFYFACCNEEDDFALFVVCDGMGGAQAGNIASKLACDTFVNSLNEFDLPGKSADTLSAYIYSSVQSANTAVFEMGLSDEKYNGMGTTLVAAMIHENRALIANVGDSRAYVVNDSGIMQITRDHSLVEDMVRRGEINKTDAKIHPKRNLITKAVGTDEVVEPDMFSLELKEGDYLILCSDGLTNLVNDDELKNTVLNLEHSDKACDILLQAAYSRGAPDNVTIVLYRN